MTTDALEAALVQFVNDRLVAGREVPPVAADTALFEEGYVNSLRVLDLIAFVERAIGRRIADREVKLANFRSIRVMARTFGGGANGAGDAPVAPPFMRRTDPTRFVSPVDALRACGDLVVPDAGRVALAGRALAMLDGVDALVRQWAFERGASEHRYPATIALETLAQAGQIASFPHQLTIAAPLAGGDANLARIAGDPHSLVATDLARPAHALSPAVCYHCYPEWASATLDRARLVTARGSCARHEPAGYAPLERQWEFTMREVVVAGSRTDVRAFLDAAIARVSAIVDSLDLDGTIEPADDPFFTSAANGRRLAQRAGGLKHELRLTLDASGRRVAVASFNDHRDHFAERFAIRLAGGGGAVAHTACVAFGLERWVLAILTQHGVDPARWPATLRALAEATA